jgi:Cytochrome domain of cellobiose dehydrogenase
LAFAYANTPVDKPADAGSSFAIHDSIGHPVFDLAVAKNTKFAAKVAKL